MTLLQKSPQHLLFHLIIPLVPYRQIHPCLFVHDTPIMAEGLESGAAVIPTHAALAHAAEGHGAGGQADDGVVDAASAKMAIVQDPPLGLFVFAEDKTGCQRGS